MNIEGIQSALVISPHADDMELACGGTIGRLVDSGAKVWNLILSVPQVQGFDLASEALASGEALGLDPDAVRRHDFPVRRFSDFRQEILDLLIEVRKKFEPEVVFSPSTLDEHQDHAVVAAECTRAFRGVTLLRYECPWNGSPFTPQLYVTLEKDDIEKQLRALAEFKSQLSMGRPYFAASSVWATRRFRGLCVRREYAEAFEVSTCLL